MSYRIVISSLAAVAIGMSCIATDASARGGGGGGGGGFGRGGGFGGGGFHSAAIGGGGFRSGVTGPTGGGGYFAAPGVRRIPRITGVGPAPSNPRHFYRLTGVGDPTAGGAAGATGGGVAAGVLYYAPASYDSNAACGRYPYPPCNKVPTR